MSILDIVGGVLAVLGALVFIGAAAGLYRFGDPYMRTSAVGTASGLGISLITLGSAMVHPKPGTIAIAIIAIVLQLITSSLGAMLVGRAAVNSHHQFTPETDTTDLGYVPRIGEEESTGGGVEPAGSGGPTAAEPPDEAEQR